MGDNEAAHQKEDGYTEPAEVLNDPKGSVDSLSHVFDCGPSLAVVLGPGGSEMVPHHQQRRRSTQHGYESDVLRIGPARVGCVSGLGGRHSPSRSVPVHAKTGPSQLVVTGRTAPSAST